MVNSGLSWQQRFITFNKVFTQLSRFMAVDKLNEMEKQGLIKGFEYTYELGWKTLQELLKENGYVNVVGPRPVIEQCIKDGYIPNGKGWIRMHDSRMLATESHDEVAADEIIDNIRGEYFGLLKSLNDRLEKERVGR